MSRRMAAMAVTSVVVLAALGAAPVAAASDDKDRVRTPRYTSATPRALDRALLERLGSRSGAKAAMGAQGWRAFLATTSDSNRAAAPQAPEPAARGRSWAPLRTGTSGAQAFAGVIDGLLRDGKLFGTPREDAPKGASILDGADSVEESTDAEGNPVVVTTSSSTQKDFSFEDSISVVAVSAVLDATTTVADADGNVLSTIVTRVNATFELQTCPSFEGRVNILGFSDASQSVNGATVSTSMNVTATGWVGDDAYLEEISWEGQADSGETSVATGGSVPANRKGKPAFGDLTVNLAEGSNQDLATFQTQLAETTFDLASTMAQDRWRSGKCTEIRTTVDGGNVPPGSETPVTATVWHRVENRELLQDVDVAFSGDQALAPDSGRHEAPVDLRYTAGPDDGDTGTITLESTSRRGKTKKSLSFTAGVLGYRIDASSGTYGDFTVSGVTCGKDHPERGPWNLAAVDHLPVIGDTPGTVNITIGPDGTGTLSGGFANAPYEVSWELSGTVALEGSATGGWQIRITQINVDGEDFGAFFPRVLELTHADECA